MCDLSCWQLQNPFISEFGDVQLDFDVQIDSILFENLQDCGVVYMAASEERPNTITPEVGRSSRCTG